MVDIELIGGGGDQAGHVVGQSTNGRLAEGR